MASTVTWDIANNWKNFRPPIRPSVHDLAVFQKYLQEKVKQNSKKGQSVRLLILGSTPELRDMAHDAGITLTICDYSKENYDALSSLCQKKGRELGKEVFLQQDWRSLTLSEKSNGRFDIIFAEASFNMVGKDGLHEVLRSLQNVLADDGIIVAKTWTLLPTGGMTFDSLLQEYRTRYKEIRFLDAVNQLLLSLFYKQEHGSVQKRYWTMKKYTDDGILTKEEFATLENHGYEASPHTIHLLPEEELIDLLKEYFSVIRIEYPAQIGMNKIPIVVMGKKS